MNLQEYLSDPCGMLSIPYWKSKELQVPPFIRIVHEQDYDAAAFADYTDEPYFRLKHDLQSIPLTDKRFVCRIAGRDDLPLMVEIINRCYTDLFVTLEQLQGYRTTPAFAVDLWIIVQDAATGEDIGCGIADFDPEAREGILEWIQVLPEYRGRGAGQFIVNELLRRMQDRVDFATVSGKVNNVTCPEKLYRRCGFVGDDVWHILVKK